MTAFLQIDFPALGTALFASVLCGLMGNFLVLRRQSLMGDAISHAVLPGIVLGFLVAGSRATLPMMLGAGAAAVLAALLIEAVRRFGRIEASAAMGVVFSVLFAGGVVLMEQAAAHVIDLDADCVLYGQLEDVMWLAAIGWRSFLDPAALADLPREFLTLGGATALAVLLLALFHKELKISTFDAGLARSLGLPAGALRVGVVLFVAVAAVASFEAVGSILVIALLICPAATARMLTDRYGVQLGLSALLGALAALLGYGAAALLPLWLGLGWSLNAAGMIATMSGLLLGLAILFGPRYGVLARRRRHRLATA